MYFEKGLQVNDKAHGIGRDDVLDLVPDEQNSRKSTRGNVKWDRRKKKFVQEDPTAEKKKKELKDTRNYYLEWQKKTHGRIQATGETEMKTNMRFGKVISDDIQEQMKYKKGTKVDTLRTPTQIRKYKEKKMAKQKLNMQGKKPPPKKVNQKLLQSNQKYAVVPPRKKRR